MYQTVMYHPGPNSDTVPDKNGNDTINCGAKKVKDRKEIIISECTMPTQSQSQRFVETEKLNPTKYKLVYFSNHFNIHSNLQY